VRPGFTSAAATGWPIEIMTSWPSYPALLDLYDAAPEAKVVLGHAGLPVERTPEYLAAWRPALHHLAERAPTMVCKISALASGADPHWTVSSLRPWVLGCVEAFGPERCMLASNWPVDKLFGAYERLWSAYDEILAELPDADRRSLFGATAERVYSL
jgi:predicted TIM-barrel fold metal-dependent hydrolase